MPAIVLDLLKYVFLAVLYIFVFAMLRAVYRELKPAPAQNTAAPAPAPARSRRVKAAPAKASVIEGSQRGRTFDLRDELVIGRGDTCHVVLDDSYASQVHARIFARDGSYMVEDLGSTNGTYLNKRRITAPVQVHRGDRIQIGKTVLELRR